MKTFYIQLNNENVITDIIEYPYDGYVQVQMTTPLPIGINAGWYIWNGTDYVLDEVKKNNSIEEQITKAVQEAEDALLEDLILRGVL